MDAKAQFITRCCTNLNTYKQNQNLSGVQIIDHGQTSIHRISAQMPQFARNVKKITLMKRTDMSKVETS
mgnify:CR=1